MDQLGESEFLGEGEEYLEEESYDRNVSVDASQIPYIHDFPNKPEPNLDDLDFEPVDYVDSCVDFETANEPVKTKIEIVDHVGEFGKIEYTLAIVKPGAIGFKREIVRRIKDEGFKIIKAKIMQLTPEVASDFFEEHYGKMWFPTFILKMCEGPILVLVLAKENAVEDFKDLMGPDKVSEARSKFPKSLRAQYGMKGDMATNAIHGSNSLSAAEREIHFFFKDIEYLPKSPVNNDIDYLKRILNPLLFEGLMQLIEIRPPDPVRWLADWLLENNPNKPKMPINIMRVPTKY